MTNARVPRLIEVACLGDHGIGRLAVFENSPQAPFRVERVYWTYGVPPGQARGMHAHRELEQIIFAVAGRISVTLENLRGETLKFDLSRPHQGLYVPPIHWRTLQFSEGAVMMCLASSLYVEAEYIREYAEFKAMRENR